MGIETEPEDRRREPRDISSEPLRLRRRVRDALQEDDLPRACEVLADAEARHKDTTDPQMLEALRDALQRVEAAKAETLRRLKRIRLGRAPRCTRCLGFLSTGANKGRLCSNCRGAEASSTSVRTVSGGLPTLGKGRR